MQVFVEIKIQPHPQPDGPGAQYGDLINIFPIDRPPFSEDEKHYFMHFVTDMDIPCLDAKEPEKYGRYCQHCISAEPGLCDFIKHKRATWTDGNILTPPRLIKKKRYQVDFASQLSPTSLSAVLKKNKTEQDRIDLTNIAIANPWSKTVITDKEAAK